MIMIKRPKTFSNTRTPLVGSNPRGLDALQDPAYEMLNNNYHLRGVKRGLDTSGADASDMVEDYSSTVLWRRYAVCPNVEKQRQGAPLHRVNCDLCDNRQYIFWEERDNINVAIHEMNAEEEFKSGGKYTTNELLITFPSGLVPNYWDQIIPKSRTILYSENVYTHQSSESVYRLKYNPIRIEKVIAAVKRENWTFDYLPPNTWIDDDVYRFELSNQEHFKVLDKHKFQILTELPNSIALSVVYWTQPVFTVVALNNVGIDSVSLFENEVSESGFETKDHGYPITVVAKLDFFINRDKDPYFKTGARNDEGDRYEHNEFFDVPTMKLGNNED